MSRNKDQPNCKYLEEPGLLAEMTDSRSGAGDVRCTGRNQGTIKDYWGCVRKTEEAKRWEQFEYQ